VVVLDEHDRVARLRFREHGIGEFPVDRLVVLEVLAAERRPDVRDMAEGPEAAVGEAVVVALFLLLREPDAPQRIGRLLGRDANMIVPVRLGSRSIGNHWLKALRLAIRQAETPTPISARPSTRPSSVGASPNSAQPSAATSSRVASTRRGPKRSSSTPAGSWTAANATK